MDAGTAVVKYRRYHALLPRTRQSSTENTVPVQRFHELRSTRVTRVYELARGRVDSRGFAGRADVIQGSLVGWRKDCSLARDRSLTRSGGSSKVAYGGDGRILKRPLFGYASRRSLGVFLPS